MERPVWCRSEAKEIRNEDCIKADGIRECDAMAGARLLQGGVLMATPQSEVEMLATQEYKYGFVTDIEQEVVRPGLNEDIIRLISAKKHEPEWLLEWRLKAFRHWLTMTEPTWAKVKYSPIDYQSIRYFAAPKNGRENKSGEIDPELLKTYAKLGIPLKERELLTGVAVDAVFDSVSVATTFKEKLGELGIIFCSFSSNT